VRGLSLRARPRDHRRLPAKAPVPGSAPPAGPRAEPRPPHPRGPDSPARAGLAYDVGVNTSIATLFEGSVTCTVLPETEQLDPLRGWMFTFSVCPKSL
jgi:hypothetical protein